MPLVLLIDHGVVCEGEHSEPPSQKRKSDNGNLNDFHNYYIYYIFYIIYYINFSLYMQCTSKFNNCQLYKYIYSQFIYTVARA